MRWYVWAGIIIFIVGVYIFMWALCAAAKRGDNNL
jgi:hypothetical protein